MISVTGGTTAVKLDIAPDKLVWHEIKIPEVDMSPRALGYNYDTWDDYYNENGWPEYCECCGHRV